MGRHADIGNQRRRRPLDPQRWGIATRSAVVSAAVVLLALLLAGAGLVAVLQSSLTSAVDEAAKIRLAEITAALQSEPERDLSDALLATNQRIAAVQIIDGAGNVVRRSSGAPAAAMTSDPKIAVVQADPAELDDTRITMQTLHTPTGTYTVLVAGGTEAVESAIRTVASLLALAAPLVMAQTAFVSYLLTKRSLRSVDAIRSQVAAISASDLSERVPVPPTGDQIAALATTMNKMLERIQTSHSAQRQFVGDASHELRSPLATIIATLEVVDAHPELLTNALAADTLLPEAHRMRDLVDDLLMLARADEQAFVPPRDVVHMDALATAEAGRIRAETSLEIGADTNAAVTTGDPRALARVLRNVLDNAARHTRTRIDITTRTVDSNVLLIVADDGPGIPAADRSRVFDRFVRLDADRSRRSGGAGLGLAIVAEIVAAHHGTVHLDERPGGGARVTVTLPTGG